MLCKIIQKFQFLRRHLHLASAIYNRIIRQINHQVLIRNIFALNLLSRRRCRLSSKHRFHAGYKLLRIKRLNHIIIRAQLQSQNLIENLSLRRKHDNRNLRSLAYFLAYAVAINTRKHQVKQNQIRRKYRKLLQCFLAIRYNQSLLALLYQIQRNQLCNIIVIVYNHDLIFISHPLLPTFP